MLREQKEKPSLARVGGGTPKDVTEVRLTLKVRAEEHRKRPAELLRLKYQELRMASEVQSLTWNRHGKLPQGT